MMAFSEDNIALFEKYLNGKMSPFEIAQFEEQLKANEFQKEFEEFKLIQMALVKDNRSKLKSHFQHIESQLSSSQVRPTDHFNRTKFFIVILTALLLAALGYIFINQEKVPDSEELYMAYYSPFPNTIDPIEKSTSNESKSSFQLYEQKLYNEAIPLLAQDSTNIDKNWYLSQAYLADNQIEKAESMLLAIITADGKYALDAKWYFALIQIRNNNYSSALELLKDLSTSTNSFYRTKSTELIKKLDSK